MKLMTKAIINKMPKIYENDGKDPKDVPIQVKFFAPWGSWTWYATEFDPDQRLFFGYVEGQEGELGYFSLDELESVVGPYGLKIERDMYYGDHTLAEVMGK